MRWWLQWTPLLHVLHVVTCECLLPLVCCINFQLHSKCPLLPWSIFSHRWHTWLCWEASPWVIASASLGPGTWWDCFCFWMRTKDASTASLCDQRWCCWKEYHYLIHGWLFQHSLQIHQSIHQIPHRCRNSLSQYVMPTWNDIWNFGNCEEELPK